MTTEEDVLARFARSLEALGIEYMIAGSLASSYHGRPRTTHDADIVIDPTAEALARLVRDLSAAGFYVDADRAQDALRRKRQFNAIHIGSAFKLDLIIRKDTPFNRQEFSRRQRGALAGASVALATAEDTIISKLEWAKQGGGSERQMEDARGIVDVKGADLDRSYIERWARALGVLDLWRMIEPGDAESVSP
jgi:hypothetical protein